MVLGGKGWDVGGATGPGIPGHLAQGRKPVYPVCGKQQGIHGGLIWPQSPGSGRQSPSPRTGPPAGRLRRAGSVTLSHSVPGADQTASGFQSQELRALGAESSQRQSCYGPRVFPGSPRGQAWPSWYRGNSTPGASRTIQAHLEEVLSCDPGLGEPSLGTERWGHVWVPAPSPTPALSHHPLSSIMFPGATLPPTPTQSP